jgi:hypothetical protein
MGCQSRSKEESRSKLLHSAERFSGESDVLAIMSQLEESKFCKLFRYLACEKDDEVINKKTIPLDLSKAEVHLTSIEDDYRGFSAYMFHQLVHLPAPLWYGEAIEEFCEISLWDALLCLKNRPDLVEMLDGTRSYQYYQEHGPPQDYFPEDYFFLSNVSHDVLGHEAECPANFRFRARKLFNRVLYIPEDRCPNFEIITPETVLHSLGRPQAIAFLVDMLNAPSSYYLLAREGRVSVVPTSEHGTFLACSNDGASDHPSVGLSARVVRSLIPTDAITVHVLSEFEMLLNDQTAREEDFQEFLRCNPQLLFAMDERYCEIRPHVCLYDSNGERLVPDFLARIQDSNIWDVIELKLPSSRPLVRHRTAARASAAAARGIAELLRYRDYFSVRENRRRMANHFGFAPYEPCLVLVMGRGNNTRFEWESTRAGFPGVQIISYDCLFQQARALCQDISAFSPSANSEACARLGMRTKD